MKSWFGLSFAAALDLLDAAITRMHAFMSA